MLTPYKYTSEIEMANNAQGDDLTPEETPGYQPPAEKRFTIGFFSCFYHLYKLDSFTQFGINFEDRRRR